MNLTQKIFEEQAEFGGVVVVQGVIGAGERVTCASSCLSVWWRVSS